jgi:hypothetical protein
VFREKPARVVVDYMASRQNPKIAVALYSNPDREQPRNHEPVWSLIADGQ